MQCRLANAKMAAVVAAVADFDYWPDLDAVRDGLSGRGSGQHSGAAILCLHSIHAWPLLCRSILVRGLVGLAALRFEVVALDFARDRVFESLSAQAERFKTVLSIANPSFSATVNPNR